MRVLSFPWEVAGFESSLITGGASKTAAATDGLTLPPEGSGTWQASRAAVFTEGLELERYLSTADLELEGDRVEKSFAHSAGARRRVTQQKSVYLVYP